MIDWEAPTGGYLLQALPGDRRRGGQGASSIGSVLAMPT